MARKRKFKWWLWLPLALISLLILIVLLALTRTVQTKIAHMVLNKFNAQIPGKIYFKSVRVSPSGRLSLYQLCLVDANRDTILSLDRLRVRFDLSLLLHDTAHVRDLVLDGLSLNIKQDSTRFNLVQALSTPKAAAEKQESKPFQWTLLLDTLKIDGKNTRFNSADTFIVQTPVWKLNARAGYTAKGLNYRCYCYAPSQFHLSTKGEVAFAQDTTGSVELNFGIDSTLISALPAPIKRLGYLTGQASLILTHDSLNVNCDLQSSACGDLTSTSQLAYPISKQELAGHGELGFVNVTPSTLLADTNRMTINGTVAWHKSKESRLLNGWNVSSNLRNSRYGIYQLVQADLNVVTKDSTATLQGNINTGNGSVQITGIVRGFDPNSAKVEGTIRTRDLNLHKLAAQVPDSISPLTCNLDFKLTGMKPETMQGEAKLKLGGLTAGKYHLDSLMLDATYNRGSFLLDTLYALAYGTTVGLRAKGERGGSLEYSLTADVPDLSRYQGILASFVKAPDSLRGALSASLSGSASLAGDRLSSLTANGDVRFRKTSYGPHSVGLAALRILNFNQDSLSFATALRLREIKSMGQIVDSVALLVRGNPNRFNTNIQLWAKADTISANGNFDIIRSNSQLDFVIRSLIAKVYDTEWATEGETEFSITGSRIDVSSVKIRSPLVVLRATGFLQQKGEQDFAIELSGFETAELGKLLKKPLPECTINMRLQLSGTENALQGDLTVTADSLRYNKMALADQVYVHTSTASGIATMDAYAIWFGDTLTLFDGTLPVDISFDRKPSIPDSLPISGHLKILRQPLEKANAYLPFGLKVKGMISADATFSGTPAHPNWSGSFQIQDGEYRDEIKGVNYKGLNIDGTLREDSLDISRFEATSKGKISGSGSALMSFPFPKRLHLDLKLDRFQAIESPSMAARLTGNVTVDGPFDRLDVNGKLRLDEVVYRITQATSKQIEEIDLNAELAKLHGDTTYTGGFVVSKLYYGISHSLQIEIPGNCWIRGGGLNLELTGNLWLNKLSKQQPSINGQIDVKSGTVQFLNRELKVDADQPAFVRFEGPIASPTIDIHATDPHLYSQQGIKIDVHVYGSPKSLQFDVMGTDQNGASMTTEQVMQALVLGQFLSPTGAAASTTDQLQSTVTQTASSQLSGLIGKLAGLDVFEYRPGAGSLGGLTGGTLEVGTYVTDRLFVRVLQPIEQNQSGQKVSIEYALLKWLKLRAEQTGRAASAFDVIVQVDWR